MKVVSVNGSLGRASSGVEYAQVYRHQIFKELGNVEDSYLFTSEMNGWSIYSMTKNIGLPVERVLTIETAPTTWGVEHTKADWSLDDIVRGLNFADSIEECKISGVSEEADLVDITDDFYIICTKSLDKNSEGYNLVDIIHNGNRVERLHLGTMWGELAVMWSEQYRPSGEGSTPFKVTYYDYLPFGEVESNRFERYSYIIDNEGNRTYHLNYMGNYYVFNSRLEFVNFVLTEVYSSLFTYTDRVIIDRSEHNVGEIIYRNKSKFYYALDLVIHANHCTEEYSDGNLLMNPYYEYDFRNKGKFDRILVSTQRQLRVLQSHFPEIKDKFVWTPLTFNKNRSYFANRGIKEENPNQLSLVTVSRLSGEKHVPWLVDAIKDFKELYPEVDVSLDIFGVGEDEAKLKKKISEYGLEGIVALRGHIPVSSKLYSGYNAYVSCSEGEGFGLSLFEALQANLPLVGYHAEYGNIEFYSAGNGVLLPKYCTSKEFARGIYEAHTKLDTLTENCKKVKKRFSKKAVVDKWKGVYFNGEN